MIIKKRWKQYSFQDFSQKVLDCLIVYCVCHLSVINCVFFFSNSFAVGFRDINRIS